MLASSFHLSSPTVLITSIVIKFWNVWLTTLKFRMHGDKEIMVVLFSLTGHKSYKIIFFLFYSMRSESSISEAHKFDSLCVCQVKFSFLKLYQMTLFIIWTGTSFCQYSLHVLKYAPKILNCVIQKAECEKHTSSFTITNQLKKSYQSVSD